MRYTVYHAKNPNFGMGDKQPFNDKHFSKVAIVEAVDLDEVFELTNHIDKPWWVNKGIIWYQTGSRSTSVGDVVVTPQGTRFMCSLVGWEQI